MFTGLVTEMAEVVSLTGKETGARLYLKANSVAKDASLGDSISINGTCLTIVEKKGQVLAFDMSGETLKTTNLGQLRTGEKVNLEPALRMGDRLGGHIVSGHIDGTGKIKSKSLIGEVYKIVVLVDRRIASLLVEKGSVAVDGISLTVVDANTDSFSVVIIPHTADVTTIGHKNAGDTVNVEVDILGKYVAKFLNRDRDSALKQTLLEEGFM